MAATITDVLPDAAPRRLGWSRLLAINAFWFGNGAHWQPIFNPLIPVGAMLIVGEKDSPVLIGRVTAAGGVLALLIPLFVGYLSDRTRSRWGRRRPWMVAGTALNVVGLFLVGTAFTPVTLVLFYLLLQGSNNVAGAAYSGVIPDVVPEGERGRASGLLGTMNGVGTVVGVLGVSIAFAILGTTRTALVVSYSYIAVVLTATLVITCVGVRERPLTSRDSTGVSASPRFVTFGVSLGIAVVALLTVLATGGGVVAGSIAAAAGLVCLAVGWSLQPIRDVFQPLRHRDFLWTFLTRMFTQMGIFTILPFMTNYFTDVVGSQNAGAASGFWLLAVIGGGIAPAILCGHFSDRLGRRKIFVYASAGIQAGVVCLLLFGLISSLLVMYVIGIIYGIGYGTYYAVDWALACDVLPAGGAEAGKDMALYHVAFTLPQVLAPALLGGVIYHLNNAGETYLGVATGNLLGYRFLFFFAAIWFILGTVMVHQIRGVR